MTESKLRKVFEEAEDDLGDVKFTGLPGKVLNPLSQKVLMPVASISTKVVPAVVEAVPIPLVDDVTSAVAGVSLNVARVGYNLLPFAENSKMAQSLALVKRLVKNSGEAEMFEDVHLPKSMSYASRVKNLFQFQLKTNHDVVEYLVPFALAGLIPGDDLDPRGPMPLISKLENVPKPIDPSETRPEVYREIYASVVNNLVKRHPDDPDPCEGYKYFGNQDYTKILPLLCQSNPFFAAALTAAGNDEYFELISYNPVVSDTDSKFIKVVRCMHPDFSTPRRINVRFNKDMTINQITTYENGTAEIVPEEKWNHYASGALYNVFYFANVQHTMIHVFHYYMTAAIADSCKHSKSMSAWATPYDDNIAIKYVQVVLTLFETKSNLGLPSDLRGHTGREGYGGTPEVMPVLREFLCIWGRCKNTDEFLKEYLHKDLYTTASDPVAMMKEGGILTELSKHFANCQAHGDELAAAMKADNRADFNRAERKLTEFLSQCGEGISSIDNISTWTQMMSLTGMLHGSTLGYSRMMIMPELMRWRDIKTPVWTASECSLMRQGTGVLVGRTDGYHVYTSGSHDILWDTSPISPGVQAVLDKFDKKATDLQTKYKDEIFKRPDFVDFGWILTDHCPDGYDGKQYTLSAYI